MESFLAYGIRIWGQLFSDSNTKDFFTLSRSLRSRIDDRERSYTTPISDHHAHNLREFVILVYEGIHVDLFYFEFISYSLEAKIECTKS